MPHRKIFIILCLCLTIIIAGCSIKSDSADQNATSTLAVEQTGTALAVSGILETPGFSLNTPTVIDLTPTPSATPIISNNSKLAVVMVKDGDVLNVYTEPGDQNGVVTTLTSHAIDIISTGNSQELEGQIWLEVRTPDNAMGWVNASYLTEQVSSTKFCEDNQINALLSQFMGAIQTRDSAKLVQVVNPRRGLIIRHEWWNPEIQYIGMEILNNIFVDSTSRNWGFQDGSGLPIGGAFKDVILPKLDDIQTESILSCNTLDQGLASGGSSGYIQWPFEYVNFNYIALYRAAAPGDELNWRTWAIGMEYINKIPYITLLVQYHWEN